METTTGLRIVHVIARLNVGGAALHVLQLARQQMRSGHDVIVVAGTLAPGEESMEYVADELGVRLRHLPALQRELSLRADSAAILALWRIMRDRRPDVLHTHTAKAGATGRLAAIAAGSARPRALVHTYHGHVLSGYFSRRWEHIFRWIERVLAHTSGTLIAVSDEVRDELVGFRVAPADRFAVVPYGFDLAPWSEADQQTRRAVRAQIGAGDETFVIGWAGRLTAIKRPLDLVRTLRALLDEQVDAVLVLVGDGEDRAAVEALAAELGVADRCRLVGFQKSIRPWYTAFDALILTSANEGTPVVAIEAFAAARPVVATRAGGTGAVVRHDESGYLEAIGDTAALAERLATLARDPALRKEMGARGADDVRVRFTVDRMAKDVEAVYRRLLSAQPGIRRSRPLTPTLPAGGRGAAEELAAPPRSLKIVLVSQYFPPEIGATQLRMQAFAEYLAARGHRVTVICEQPNHPHGVIPASYRGVLVEDDRSNEYRVLRVWVKASREKTQRTRMAFYLSFMGMSAAVAPMAGRADVVFATTPPLFTGAAGLTIARMNRVPLVLDVRDLWPAAAVSLNQIGEGLPLKLAEYLERQLYRQAEVVTAVTRPFCDHIDALRDGGPDSVLLPNGTLDMFLEDGASERLAAPGGFLVTFAGTHGIAQALPSVLDAAERVGSAAHFAFVGDGAVKPLLVEEARNRNLTNVGFHAQRSATEIQGALRGSDALLVPLSAHPTFADFVPSKMIDFMAIGRPIVLSAKGEAARILNTAGAGIAVQPEDPDALAAAIHWLAQHPAEASEMGEKGRAFARRRLRSEQAQRLEELLLDVTSRRR
jgi:glycosyltransferase involved in cell wall biosynthesis